MLEGPWEVFNKATACTLITPCFYGTRFDTAVACMAFL